MDNKTTDYTDDFLNFSSGNVSVEAAENTKKKVKIDTSESEGLLGQDGSTPKLDDEDVFPPEYLRIVNRIKAQYALLPVLDYDSIDREIRDLTVQSCPTPTLEVLNDELHRVQASKDRLSEILIDVIKCYNFKKRAVDILREAWGKFTSEKNTESRKGDAAFRLSFFLIDFARTESLFKSCDHIMRNLDSLQDNLSRRITIWQLLLKVREGRMALPDHDFDKEIGKELGNAKIDALFSGDQKDNEEENNSNNPKLMEF